MSDRMERDRPLAAPGLVVQAVESVRRAADRQERMHALAVLRAELTGLSKSNALQAVLELLRSGGDAPTGLEFGIGGDGFLASAPTLRVFLLDYLARIDSAAAAEYAREVLRSYGSADEWAVAFRSYALANDSLDDRRFLRERFAAMVTHEPWRQNPSTGFLEAFDVAVFVGGTDLFPLLGDAVRDVGSPAVARAAYLALDRLVLREPATALARWQRNPSLLAGREETRACYFARADVTQPEQREVVERYLLDPARSTVELNAFARLFPNANFMVSPNLLSGPPALTHDELVRRDRAALEVVEAWEADPRFAMLQPHLTRVADRLREYLKPH